MEKTRPARILVVDDDPTVRLLLKFQLSKAGYVVSVAHRGEEVLEMSRRFDPDAIVLDLNLPEISGVEVLRQLRLADGDRHRVIVVLSASVQSSASLAALQQEADSVESKPIAPSTLRQCLVSHCVPPQIISG